MVSSTIRNNGDHSEIYKPSPIVIAMPVSKSTYTADDHETQQTKSINMGLSSYSWPSRPSLIYDPSNSLDYLSYI